MKILYNISVFLCLFYFTGVRLNAQNETKIWYFGNHAGLDFNTSPPTILTNGALGSINQEGSACISDQNGNLLFYTDGETIWDKTHNPMTNGTNLFGHTSTTQSSLILKKPNSANLYYVFTLDGSANTNNGLCYSIVDMNLAVGNGSVITKNNPLFAPSEEKLTCAMHANGTDVWILTHDYDSQNFRAHLLTSTGINTTAVISSLGIIHDGNPTTTLGYMKASPDGKKVALAIIGLNSLELLDFDNSSGLFSNSVILTNNLSAYGCEFSSDSKKLYSASTNSYVLYQWDLCKTSSLSIIQSQTAIATLSAAPGGMQLSVDGKIYISRFQQSILGTISFPNLIGTACSITEFGQSVAPNTCIVGLPNFPPYLFKSSASLTITALPQISLCSGETLTLTSAGANSYTWSTAQNGASISISPTVTASYFVIGTSSVGCLEASVTLTVNACTGLEEINPNGLNIYPNPLTEKLHLEQAQAARITILNALGKIVYSTAIYGNTEIDFKGFPVGIYYLRIENAAKQSYCKRLLKL